MAQGDHYSVLQTLKALIVRAQKKGDVAKAADLGKHSSFLNAGIYSYSFYFAAHLLFPLPFFSAAKGGALVMLQHGYGTAGLDLALNLVETWEGSSTLRLGAAEREAVEQISDAFVAGVEDKAEAAKLVDKFIARAIEWSKAEHAGSFAVGEPGFHHIAAKMKVKCGDLEGANDHYVKAQQPQEFAAFLYGWAQRGYANERDLFLCRAVLELLVLENLKDANLLWESFNAILISKKEPLDTPLFHYTGFLLKTLERDAYPLFQVLREKYAPVIASDPTFVQYLDKIAHLFFGVAPQKHGMAAMIENMFGGMKP